MSRERRLSKKSTASRTAIFIKEAIWGLRDRIGLGEDAAGYGEASVFEALEPRVLLSANPLNDLNAHRDAGNQQIALLNDALAVVYMSQNTDSAAAAQAVASPVNLASPLAGGGTQVTASTGPVVEIIHDAPEKVYPGQTITFSVVATDPAGISSRGLSINGQIVQLDATYSSSYTFTAPGTYTVVASARNTERVASTKTLVITVLSSADAPPAVTLGHNAPSSLYAGQTVDFKVNASSDSYNIVSYSLTINGQDVAVDANGNSTFTFTNAGTYTLKAYATDSAGNVGVSEVLTLTVLSTPQVDSEAPVVSIDHNAPTTINPGQKIDFAVTATDNVGVTGLEFRVNGNLVTLDGSGRASYTFNSLGTYTITAAAWDAAGNIGYSTLILTIVDSGTADLEAPTVSITHNAPAVLNPGQAVEFTVDARDNIGVTRQEFTINGNTVALDGNGKASYVFSSAGVYTIKAEAWDAAGNYGHMTLVLTIVEAGDAEAPVVSIAHNAPSTINPGQAIEFTVTATDNVGVVSRELTINGKTVALDAEYKAGYVFTAAGTYTIVATARDAAGNTGTYTLTFEIVAAGDSEAPTVKIAHNGGVIIRPGQTIDFTVVAEDNVGVVSRQLLVNGQNVALNASNIASYTFTEAGIYTISALAKDAAGNTGIMTLTLTVVAEEVKNPAPVVDISHNGGNGAITAGQTLAITVGVTSDNAIVARTLIINGKTVTLGNDSVGSYTFSSPGIYTIIATAVDSLGNVGAKTMVVSVIAGRDVEAPVVTIVHDAPSVMYAGQTVNFTVEATDNVGVVSRQFTVNGKTVTLDASGKASYTFAAGGVYTIVATAYDAAGNLGMQTLTLYVVDRDVEAPVVVIEHDARDTMFAGDAVTFTVHASDNVAVVSRQLTINGKAVALDADGKATFAFGDAGTYVIVATAYDAAGNVGMQTITFTVLSERDTEAPTVDIAHNAPSVINPGQKVDFTVIAGDNVEVIAKSLVINGQNVVLDANGQASFVFTQTGTYTIMAIAMDSSGNIATKTIVLTVSAPLDVEAPMVSIIHNSSAQVKPGQTVDFTVNATDNVGVVSRTLSINGQYVTLDANHQASYLFTTPGVYTIVATAEDAAGNVGTQVITLTVVPERDSEAPVVDITHNAPDIIVPGQSVEFTVVATDNVGVVSRMLTINGQFVALDANGRATYTFAEPGTYTITAYALDAAGNLGMKTITLEVISDRDVVAPEVLIVHDSNGIVRPGQSVNFAITATDNVGVVLKTLSINGVDVALDADGKAVYTFSSPGVYTVYATARDAAGNIGTQTITFTVAAEADSQAPTVDLTHNGSGEVYAGTTLTFTVIATDNTGVAGRTLTVNGQTLVLDANGQASYTFANAGTYTFVATAWDAAGNIGTKTITVIVPDTQAPLVDIVHDGGAGAIYTHSTLTFAVVATDNVGVVGQTLTVNGQTIALDASGMGTFTFSAAGQYTFVATAWDAAGNIGTKTLVVTVVDDVDAPTVDIVHNGGTGVIYDGSTLTFTVNATDNVGVVGRTLTINGQTVTLDGNNQGTFTFATPGTYEVVATAVDAEGNVGTATLSLVITYYDNVAPVVDVTHDGGTGSIYTGSILTFTVSASDNIGVVSRTLTVDGKTVTLDGNYQASFVFTKAGTYTIVATAKDAMDNEGGKTITVTIVDDVDAPVVDVTHNGGTGIIYNGSTLTFTVSATDNVGVVSRTLTINGQTITLDGNGQASFTFARPGTYEVIATATDAAGNVGTKTIGVVITYFDNVAPVVDVTHNGGTGSIYAGSTLTFSVSATDDVGVVSRTLTIDGKAVTLDANYQATYTFTKAGTYTVIATAKDAMGNEGIKTITVTIVDDTEKPVVDVTHNGGTGTIYNGSSLTFTVSATDNVGVVSRTLTIDGKAVTLDGNYQASYTFTKAGTYTVIATATDAAGNVGTKTIQVVITYYDNVAPVVDVTHNGGTGSIYTNSSLTFTVSATDDVGVVSRTLTIDGKAVTLDGNYQASYTFTKAGTYTVIATAKDAMGNEGIKTITVTIVDDAEEPVVDVTHNGGTGTIYNGSTLTFTVSATDNVGVASRTLTIDGKAVTLDSKHQASYTFDKAGTYTVIATATDAAGNVGTKTIQVVITYKDTEKPVVDVTHNGGTGSIYTDSTLTFTVSATDNIGVVSRTLTIDGKAVTLDAKYQASYTFTAAGTYTVVATATDAAGNVGSKTITVTIVKDTVKPVVDVTHNGGTGVIYDGSTLVFTVSATDNVGVVSRTLTIDGKAVTLDSKHQASYTFEKAGSYTVVATATDAAGNVGTKSITVVITYNDTVKPVVDVTHNGGTGTIYTGSTLVFTVSATDNIGVVSRTLTIDGKAVTLDAKYQASYTFTAAGTYTVVATATDAAGNVGTKSITVTIVKDTVKPVVNVTHNGGTGVIYAGSTLTFTVSATDNVGVVSRTLTIDGKAVTLDSNHQASYTFSKAGCYTIIATATDAAGNVGTKTVTVTVCSDTVKPVVDVTHNGGTGVIYDGSTLTFTVSATDNVGVASRTLTIDGKAVTLNSKHQASYTFDKAGTYTVIATATDAAGNVGTKTIQVVITYKDTEKPVVDVTHNGGTGSIYTDSTLTFTISATDNIGVVSRTLTIDGKAVTLDSKYQASYTFTAAGTYTVVATATDAAGNVGTKTITVTIVKDAVKPVVDVTHNGGTGVIYDGSTLVFTVSATDNVGVVSRTLTIDGKAVTLNGSHQASYTFDKAGSYTVVATATDAAGNVGTKSITVVITYNDTVKPVVDVTHNGGTGTIYTGSTLVFTVSATDNIGVVSRTLTIDGKAVTLDAKYQASYTFTAAGSYTVVATATDAAGNVGTKSITVVIVKDAVKPVVDVTHNGGTGTIYNGSSLTFTVSATDNVGVVSRTLTIDGKAVTLNGGHQASYTLRQGRDLHGHRDRDGRGRQCRHQDHRGGYHPQGHRRPGGDHHPQRRRGRDPHRQAGELRGRRDRRYRGGQDRVSRSTARLSR